MSENVPSINPATIKIKKNYGITHALKDLVEWNAVLDKLVELQNNRKAEGKASIFGGGTDKTKAGWHNSFVVHPDQQIEFTAEETAQLYEAMGVKLTGTQAEKPEENETPAPEEKPATNETPKVEEKPDEGTPGPNGTTIKNGQYYAQDGKRLNPHYARGTEMKFDESGVSARVFDDGSNVTYRDKDGKLIPQQQFIKDYPNEYIQVLDQQFSNYAGKETLDGKFSGEFKQDENGEITAFFTYNGKTIKSRMPVSVKNVMDKFGIPQRKIEEPAPEAAQEQPTAPSDTTQTVPPETTPVDSTETVETPAAKAPEKPAETPKAEEKPETTTPTPTAAGTPQERLAANPYVKATEPPEGITAKQGKDAGNNDCEIWTDKDGREVKRIYEKGDADNEYCVVTEYDNNGKKTAELETKTGSDSDKLDLERQYDENGKFVKQTRYNNDGTLWWVEEYNADEKLVKEAVYNADGKTVDYTNTYKYNEDGSYTKTRTRGDDTLSYVREKDNKDRTTKYTEYKEDGKTVNYTETYKYNEDGSYTKTRTRGNNTAEWTKEFDKDRNVTKETYYKADGKTVDFTDTYTYDDKDGSKTITSTRGDGTVAYIGEYDKDGNKPKETYYKEDGKTVDRLVENGVLRLTHIKSKNSDGIERDYKFEFDENGVCTKSVLADSLYNQISGPSLNSNTIALLEYINPENVIKVLTSYEAVAGQSLVQALQEEWFMGEEPIKKYIEANLEKRLEQLGIKDEKIDFSNPEFVAKLAKLDNEKTI